MRMKLYELLTQLAEKSSCEYIMHKGDCFGELVVNGLHIEFVVLENSDRLIVQTAVGVFPEHNREGLLIKLMNANNLFKYTNGMTLGLDINAKLITLQTNRQFSILEQTSFEALLTDFFNNVAELMGKYYVWQTEISNNDESLAQTDEMYTNAIKI